MESYTDWKDDVHKDVCLKMQIHYNELFNFKKSSNTILITLVTHIEEQRVLIKEIENEINESSIGTKIFKRLKNCNFYPDPDLYEYICKKGLYFEVLITRYVTKLAYIHDLSKFKTYLEVAGRS